ASPLLGMVNDRTLALAGESITGGMKSPRRLLKVHFTSATNLSRFVTENSYSLGNTTFFCSREKSSPVMSFPDVFWRGARLGPLEDDPIERSRGRRAYGGYTPR